MGIIKFLFNRDKIENPAKINLKNIKKFIEGNFYKLILKIPFIKDHFVDKARVEQYTWRRKCVQEKSPLCLEKGECFCGCDTEGLILANPGCEQKGECFPPLMDTLTWKKYKIEHEIVL